MVEYVAGSATSANCPRKGEIWLTKLGFGTVRLETACKTWGCLACRDRLQSLFQMRVVYGCSALGECAFITLTLRMGEGLGKDARYVAKVWREFWRRWKAAQGEQLQWLRVVELTKQQQPHLHLVAGPIQGRIRCYGNERLQEKSFKARSGCDCLSHRMSAVWEGITGAWMVHTKPVVGPNDAATYMGKYMAKGHLVRDRLEQLGFARRWSSSRGWPGNGRLRLQGTVDEVWTDVSFHRHTEEISPAYHEEEVEKEHELNRRAGTDLALLLNKDRRKKGKLGRLERMLNAEHDSQANRLR